jgi:AcrR family transcriptional regulator
VEAILDAAARILRQDGAAALTTNRISEVAGFGVATLYGYFPNKTAILIALARRLMAEDEAAVTAAVRQAPPGGAVRAAIRTLLRRHREDAAVRQAVMSVHHSQGLATEHTLTAQRAIGGLLVHTGPPPHSLRLFVVTRAILGVARALVEEAPEATEAELEDELVRLAELSLGSDVG